MGFVDTAKFISQKIGSLIQVNSVKKLTKRIKGLEKIRRRFIKVYTSLYSPKIRYFKMIITFLEL